MSEIRENPLTGEWVIIAPARAKRGGNVAAAPAPPDVPDFLEGCPFCPGNETLSEECFRVGGANGGWSVRSVLNKFSVLSSTGEVARPECSAPGQVSVNAVGRHEVIVESPRHDFSLGRASQEDVERILLAYRERFLVFSADPRVRHVIVFKNHGAEAGASQQHPHSQIVGLPILPGQVEERIERSQRYLADNAGCLGCALIARERGQACRIVAENDAYVAFIPYAALSPYHLWIFPKQHAACFAAESGMGPLAEILRAVLGKVCGMLGNPAYNLIIRSLGPEEKHAPHFHWYISIVPRVNKRAGFELGTGMYINPSSPETCAQALREFAPRKDIG